MIQVLPEGFATLEPFVEHWIAATADQRDQLRASVPADERKSFYAAFQPLIGDALDHLDSKALTEFDAAEKRLMQLALTYAHAAQAEEVQGPDEAKHAPCRRRLPITRAPADL